MAPKLQDEFAERLVEKFNPYVGPCCLSQAFASRSGAHAAARTDSPAAVTEVRREPVGVEDAFCTEETAQRREALVRGLGRRHVGIIQVHW